MIRYRLSHIAKRIAAPLDELYDLRTIKPNEEELKELKKDDSSDTSKGWKELLESFDLKVRVFLVPNRLDADPKKYMDILEAAGKKSSSSVNLLIHAASPALETSANWAAHDVFHTIFEALGVNDLGYNSPEHRILIEHHEYLKKVELALSEDFGYTSKRRDLYAELFPVLIKEKDASLLKYLPGYQANVNTKLGIFDTLADFGVLFFKFNGDANKFPELEYKGDFYLDKDQRITPKVEIRKSDLSNTRIIADHPDLPKTNEAIKTHLEWMFGVLKSMFEMAVGEWLHIPPVLEG
jgi:hypothetical protein